ncbi:MAG: hypothetical protein K0S55_798 [Clostridia bacterium]|jgi:lipid II:glycine glycyltransferase (peptidoglycan interpeptide bridge formation enzyme)|nr:hypothetical protein [Clostridia bacterium]
MISAVVKKRGIKTITTWFYDGTELNEPHDIVMHVEAIKKPENVINKEFKTIVIDLSKNEDDLYNNLDKQCKQEIRRALRDGIKYECLDSIDLKDEKLNKYIEFYNNFARKKNISDCEGELLKELRDNNLLFISNASLNDDILVCNIYVADETHSRHIYSASLRYFSVNPNLVGRANRMLHWKDILYFKKRNIMIYDMGGISYKEELINITRFKLQFGGEEKNFYSYVQFKTLKGNLYNKSTNLIEKLFNRYEFYKKKKINT